MMHRFTILTICLASTVAFLVGLIVAGSLMPAAAPAAFQPTGVALPPATSVRASLRPVAAGPIAAVVNFADVAGQLNAAVVNIDATGRYDQGGRRFRRPPGLDPFDERRDGDLLPRRGAGSGFVVEPDGHILTNHHVIEGAERIIVRLSDGRSLRASVVGSDPATDIALIKVEAGAPLATASLGNSDELRVGEWVCAIGNPLAYDHTVTVGVVSFIGRKLFNPSLDDYIQTDAAINFGNSGGPLINARGEVIGINTAISSRASSIGFAVPINQAKSILPQLKARGRVVRGYIGVTLTDVGPEMQQSLRLGADRGALVMDVEDGSPGQRAGIRPYDLIVSVDGRHVDTNDELIRYVSGLEPGSTARLQVLRDDREQTVQVKLAERPTGGAAGDGEPARPARPELPEAPPLGIGVSELTRESARRLGMPEDVRGVLVARVDPASAGADAALERGFVIMEINRQRVASVADYNRIVRAARPDEVLVFYIYRPTFQERKLVPIRVDAP
jgi:serine protease Do